MNKALERLEKQAIAAIEDRAGVALVEGESQAVRMTIHWMLDVETSPASFSSYILARLEEIRRGSGVISLERDAIEAAEVVAERLMRLRAGIKGDADDELP